MKPYAPETTRLVLWAPQEVVGDAKDENLRLHLGVPPAFFLQHYALLAGQRCELKGPACAAGGGTHCGLRALLTVKETSSLPAGHLDV